MSLLIQLTPAEEARVADAARQTGLTPEAYVADLIRTNLPADDGTPLEPDIPAAELLAPWAQEDAGTSPDEQAENDRIYAEIQADAIARMHL